VLERLSVFSEHNLFPSIDLIGNYEKVGFKSYAKQVVKLCKIYKFNRPNNYKMKTYQKYLNDNADNKRFVYFVRQAEKFWSLRCKGIAIEFNINYGAATHFGISELNAITKNCYSCVYVKNWKDYKQKSDISYMFDHDNPRFRYFGGDFARFFRSRLSSHANAWNVVSSDIFQLADVKCTDKLSLVSCPNRKVSFIPDYYVEYKYMDVVFQIGCVKSNGVEFSAGIYYPAFELSTQLALSRHLGLCVPSPPRGVRFRLFSSISSVYSDFVGATPITKKFVQFDWGVSTRLYHKEEDGFKVDYVRFCPEGGRYEVIKDPEGKCSFKNKKGFGLKKSDDGEVFVIVRGTLGYSNGLFSMVKARLPFKGNVLDFKLTNLPREIENYFIRFGQETVGLFEDDTDKGVPYEIIQGSVVKDMPHRRGYSLMKTKYLFDSKSDCFWEPVTIEHAWNVRTHLYDYFGNCTGYVAKDACNVSLPLNLERTSEVL